MATESSAHTGRIKPDLWQDLQISENARELRTTLTASAFESARKRQAFVLGWPLAYLGGVNEVVRNLIREFQAAGDLAPLLIEMTGPEIPLSVVPGVPVLRVPLRAPFDPRHPIKAGLLFCWHLPRVLWHLRTICRTYGIDVLNPHFVGLESFPLVILRRAGFFTGKLILSFHGSDLRAMIQSKGVARALLRIMLREADALVPCSTGLGEEILMIAPECAGRIVPIQNGIDIDRVASGIDVEVNLPQSFSGRKRLLNIGAFEYKKAHDVLLKAFAAVRRAGHDVCLIIAGQTNAELAATQKLIDRLGLSTDVVLFRDVPHATVLSLLRSSDVFVLSSRWEKGVCGEGFAMALLEAAAVGKPVVSTASCGVAELLDHENTGLIVPPDRPDLLAQAIEQTLSQPDQAARQARNLHNLVRVNFTWAAAHARYLQVANRGTGEKSTPS